jgi:hypothetical protein
MAWIDVKDNEQAFYLRVSTEPVLTRLKRSPRKNGRN